MGRVFRNFFQRLCLNGTGGKPNSESAKRSLTILSQSAIPGLVKPNSESAELDTSLSAKYKQPVYVFLHCAPDSWLLCYPTPICKICPALKETSGRGVNYLRRQIENSHLWLVQRRTSLAKQTKQKTNKKKSTHLWLVQRRTSLGATWLSLSPGSPLLRSTDGWKSLSRSTWKVDKVEEVEEVALHQPGCRA